MLNGGWLRRFSPLARRVMVFGDTPAARLLAQGAGSAGMRVSSHDISYLRGAEADADGLIIDTGREDATLEEAARLAARKSGGTIGVVVESWAGFTAALALDAGLGTRGVRIRPLSMSERRVRATLAMHPWWRLRRAAAPSTALVFGTGPLAEHLVVALFRAMHLAHQTPQVVVVGTDAPDWVAALHAAMPQLKDIGSLVGARRAPGLEGACALYALTASSDLAAFSPAVPLVWLGDGDCPARSRPGPPADWQLLAQSLFNDPEDDRAAAIHGFYFEAALRDGNQPGSRPSMLPWPDLPERFRQASRYQADHVPAKLAMIGCRPVAMPERWRLRFSTGEVDALARVEHERWSAVQMLDGWRYGATRDDAGRVTPFLRPYDELAPEIQDRDRMPVRQIPAQLARIGHGVRRDAVVTLTAEPNTEPGFAFAFLFRSLLADIARRYPDRSLVLATALGGPLERRAAEIALSRRLPLRVLLPPGAATPEDPLLARAKELYAPADNAIAALGTLHVHVGVGPPQARRLVLLSADGRVQAAPWL